MSTQHPITPPPELVEQWLSSHDFLWGPVEQGSITITPYRLQNVATRATQWGADQELEACCHEVQDMYSGGSRLRAARRPKPPGLNSIALQMLGTIERDDHYIPEITDTIRRALEALPNG
jgi:hypothetical protein